MTINTLSETLKERFGENLLLKAIEFPSNMVNFISIRDNPLKIRAVVLDNDREFHLIINKAKGEIFHDCPSFLIHSEKEQKVCIHFLKLLLLIKENIALEILNDFQSYTLTLEDFGSKKKSKNFAILANNCFKRSNCVEGLNYLKKAVIDQYECGIYDRIEGWFEGLGIKFKVSPRIDGCLMHQGKKCVRNFTFIFPQLGKEL